MSSSSSSLSYSSSYIRRKKKYKDEKRKKKNNKNKEVIPKPKIIELDSESSDSIERKNKRKKEKKKKRKKKNKRKNKKKKRRKKKDYSSSSSNSSSDEDDIIDAFDNIQPTRPGDIPMGPVMMTYDGQNYVPMYGNNNNDIGTTISDGINTFLSAENTPDKRENVYQGTIIMLCVAICALVFYFMYQQNPEVAEIMKWMLLMFGAGIFLDAIGGAPEDDVLMITDGTSSGQIKYI